ncbi:MAG TPA: dihydropyrimidinase [Dongiaceae bacterium]|nr:dihydropyrimidinase [Dongiaceae bacterium]
MAATSLDLLIRNGTVATAGDVVRCDIGIRGGRIVALGEQPGTADEVIDATGRLVTPGGVDSHCHMDQQPWEGQATVDDFRSGTISAACGGTTTVIPFAMPLRGQSLRAVVDDYHVRARGKAVIDYAFHLVVSDPSPQVLGQDLPALIRDGCTSFKVYLTYEGLALADEDVLNVLDVAKREGAMVMVHAENDAVVRWLTDRLLAQGKSWIKHHLDAHPAIGDREATHRAISFSELMEVPILITHVSHRDGAEQIRWAQTRGLKIYGETCPQYLFLSSEDIEGTGNGHRDHHSHAHGMEGAKYVCTPPPRDKANQEHIWRGLQNGTFQVLSSDHSAYRFTDKIKGGPNTPFTNVPNGVPGIELRMPLLLSEGVGKGRITLNQFVALTATNAARIYGLYPRKGTIAVGADADIAIWDAEREWTVTHGLLHDNCDYTPYEGMRLRGWPMMTLSRGEIVWNGGEPLGAPGRGRFLRCDLPESPRP